MSQYFRSICLPKFYPIIDASHWLPIILPLGVKLVQLRIKDQPPATIMSEIRLARSLCAQFGCTLVINDYWEQSINAGCDFVHLGQEDLIEADLSAIRRAGMYIGISTHSEAELEIALSHDPDYIALGPVYETTLKDMPWVPQGLERVRQWKDTIGSIPLVGIGGLRAEGAREVLSAGADSLAAVTDVILHPEPEARVRLWLSETNRVL